MISTYSGGDSWLRRWSVALFSTSGTVLELSAGGGASAITGGAPATGPQGEPLSEGLKIDFHTHSWDDGVPAHAEITVWNLSDATARRVMGKEFSYVVLQAGYSQGYYGIIHSGTLIQYKRGKRSATDSYLILYSRDGDWLANNWIVNNGLGLLMARGSNAQQRADALFSDATENGGVQAGPITGLGTGGILPRGKVLWGLGNQNLDTTSMPYASWSVQNGVLQVNSLTGYQPGEAVQLNIRTGLVNQPEATTEGIFAVSLLNPKIKVRTRVQINNAAANAAAGASEPAISTTVVQQPTGYPQIGDVASQLFASTADDGIYTVIYLEHEGSSRQNEWYTKMIMLLLDQSTGETAPGVSPTPLTIEQAFQNALANGQASPITISTN